MANSIVQTIREAEIDARSLSEFVYNPADAMVSRRLAPSIHTLNYYLRFFDTAVSSATADAKEIKEQLISAQQQAQGTVSYIENTIRGAIDTTVIENSPVSDALVSVDSSLSQRTINKGLESIADLSTIKNPKNGLRVYVKSYHAGLGKGGGYFTYDSTKSSINDGGVIINGWVRDNTSGDIEAVWFGVKGDKVTNDTDSLQKALDYAYSSRQDLKLCEGINLTGGTLYMPAVNWPEVITIHSGEIIKKDSGYIISCKKKDLSRDAPVLRNISFLGKGGAAGEPVPVVYDANVMIRQQVYDCRFRFICLISLTDDTYLQTVRIEGNTVYYAPDSFVKATTGFDVKVLRNAFESSNFPAFEFTGTRTPNGPYGIVSGVFNDNVFEGFRTTSPIVVHSCMVLSISNNYFEANLSHFKQQQAPDNPNNQYALLNMQIMNNYFFGAISTKCLDVISNSIRYSQIQGNQVRNFATPSPDNVFISGSQIHLQLNANDNNSQVPIMKSNSIRLVGRAPSKISFETATSGNGIRATICDLFNYKNIGEVIRQAPEWSFVVTISGKTSGSIYRYNITGFLSFGVAVNAGSPSLIAKFTPMNIVGVTIPEGSLVFKFVSSDGIGHKYDLPFTKQQLYVDIPSVMSVDSLHLTALTQVIQETSYNLMPYLPDAG